jgi:hypothetical protein
MPLPYKPLPVPNLENEVDPVLKEIGAMFGMIAGGMNSLAENQYVGLNRHAHTIAQIAALQKHHIVISETLKTLRRNVYREIVDSDEFRTMVKDSLENLQKDKGKAPERPLHPSTTSTTPNSDMDAIRRELARLDSTVAEMNGKVSAIQVENARLRSTSFTPQTRSEPQQSPLPPHVPIPHQPRPWIMLGPIPWGPDPRPRPPGPRPRPRRVSPSRASSLSHLPPHYPDPHYPEEVHPGNAYDQPTSPHTPPLEGGSRYFVERADHLPLDQLGWWCKVLT